MTKITESNVEDLGFCNEIIHTFRTHLHIIFILKNPQSILIHSQIFKNKFDANLSTNCTPYFITKA